MRGTCAPCGVRVPHAGYVIQLMNGPPPRRKKRRRQRGQEYGAQVDDAIRVIGKALDWVCAETLKPALPKMAGPLTKSGEVRMTSGVLHRYFGKKLKGAKLTRSRPWQTNR